MDSGTPSPIDLPEREMEEGGLVWTFAVIIIASLFLLATNGVSLRDWIDDQPPGPLQARAAALADQWVDFTEAVGIAIPREAMHTQWKRAEEARFHAIDPSEEKAAAPAPQR
ncbi:hypothetical protein [Sphingomonas crusticola]|uniref:hypothetical protein n=1 Tax=Sphingomonas crusticola TaxID=1697973 RepID=UPI000E26D5AD|nr:hypothetical protein [Sphingomonas crusticola]